jgi:hypothetical protein
VELAAGEAHYRAFIVTALDNGSWGNVCGADTEPISLRGPGPAHGAESQRYTRRSNGSADWPCRPRGPSPRPQRGSPCCPVHSTLSVSTASTSYFCLFVRALIAHFPFPRQISQLSALWHLPRRRRQNTRPECWYACTANCLLPLKAPAGTIRRVPTCQWFCRWATCGVHSANSVSYSAGRPDGEFGIHLSSPRRVMTRCSFICCRFVAAVRGLGGSISDAS